MSDGHVLESALRVLADGGRERFTLARAAAAAGVAAPTLLQRYGSKADLLLAALAYNNAWLKVWLERQSRSDIPRLLGDIAAGFGEEPRFGEHLAMLGLDLEDPDTAALVADRMELIRTAVLERLELRGPERAAAARLIETHWHGAVVRWATDRRGRVGAAVERSLRELMERTGW